jgi:hypothetical protein
MQAASAKFGMVVFFGLFGCSITCHYSMRVAGVIVGLARDRSYELGVNFVFKQMDVSQILVVLCAKRPAPQITAQKSVSSFFVRI